MVQGYEILKKLTTRNILAQSIIGTFLYGIIYGLHNIESVAKAIESSSVLSLLLGTFIAIVPVVVYFYFRKPPTNETK